MHPDAVDIVCEPRAGKIAPRSPYEAKFSLPWSVAALLLDGAVGVDTYAPAMLGRADIAELAARVTVHVVPGSVAAADAPGRVAVTTRDGSTLVGAVSASTGGPAHPMTAGALLAKFERNVGDAAVARALAPLLLDLAVLPTLEPLLDLAAGVR